MSFKLEHEVPTHLEIRDKSFFGLDFYQFMLVSAGLLVAGLLYNSALAWLPLPLRLACSGLFLAGVMALVLVRPGGISLLDWLLDRLRFYGSPCAAVFDLRALQYADEQLLPAAEQ